MKKIIYFLMLGMILMSVTSCSYQRLEEEDIEEQVLSVSDTAYYERFKNDNISINVYNWGEYISDGSDGLLDINAEFEKLTGISVNYSTYATNEELYAKLKGGASDYDIIIPSEYMISRMIKEGLLNKINLSNIPNFENVMEKFKNQSYDPGNQYSIPYTWGTVGIIYDKTAIDDDADIDWDILWDERYKDSILMFDNPRDAFAIAETVLGYSMNTEDPDQIRQAAQKLKEQKSIVQAYVMDEIFDKMGSGEAVLAPYYAGDAITLMDEYEHIGFVVPKSGTNLFFDAMCIPYNAKNQEAAEMYINFMLEPDVAYATTSYIGYSTPNEKAFEMLDDEVKNDGISYLSDEYIKDKATVYVNLSEDTNKLMQELWTDMKSAEENDTNRWLVPIFLLLCILLSIGIIIKRYIKNKKDIF